MIQGSSASYYYIEKILDHLSKGYYFLLERARSGLSHNLIWAFGGGVRHEVADGYTVQ